MNDLRQQSISNTAPVPNAVPADTACAGCADPVLPMSKHVVTPQDMLLTLTLLALVATVFAQALGGNLRIGNATERARAAGQLAENLIARAGAELSLEGLNAAGRYDGMAWRLTSREVARPAQDDAIPRLFEVDATISWSGGGPGRQRDLKVTTFKLEQRK